MTPDDLTIHADWSIQAKKRWMAVAERAAKGWRARELEIVPEPRALLAQLRDRAAAGAAVLAGFDFPIGLPAAYAEKAGIVDFRATLPELGRGDWNEFFESAERPAEISPARPFYPLRPGGTKFVYLLDGLGLTAREELLRLCDRKTADRPAASPIFWTLGANQVGRAAIAGWRDLIGPATRTSGIDLAIWPFDGDLEDLVRPGRIVIVETYPAEAYRHLGIEFPRGREGEKHGKTVQEDRLGNADRFTDWARSAGVALDPGLQHQIRDGFGADADGEDRFDALVGLFGMLEVVLGRRSDGAPADPRVRLVEGWILGQEPG